MPIISKKEKLNEITFFTHNDCRIEFIFDTVRAGSHGKGSFVIKYTMSIYNPFLSKISNEPFDKNPDYAATRMTELDCFINEHYETEKFLICEHHDNLQVLNYITSKIEKHCMPIVKPFTGKYEDVLNYYTDYAFYKNWGWRDFTWGVVFACLLNEEEFIEEKLVLLAANTPHYFHHFKKTEDYHRDIVIPIKNYIQKIIS